MASADNDRVIAIIAIMVVIALFVATNDEHFSKAAGLYVLFGLVAPTLYKLEIFGDLTTGIDANYIADGVFGVAVALIIIYLNSVNNSFAILLPQLEASLGRAGQFLILCVFAPIAENLVFIGGLLPILQRWGLSYVQASAVMGVAAAAFHATAYRLLLPDGSFTPIALLSGTFLSAAFIFFVFAIMTRLRKSQVSGIMTHAVLNGYLARSVLFAVSGVPLF